MATMPPLPGSWNTLTENYNTLPTPLPGGVPTSIYVYPSFFHTQPGDVIHTFAIDFVSPLRISPELMFQAVDHVAPMFLDGGEELGFYFLWEKQEFDISIPEQFCFFGRCWTPPWAGRSLLVVYHYRLWLVSVIPAASPFARPALPALAIIAIFAGICMVIGTIASVVFFAEGRVTVEQIKEGVEGVVKAPGENIKAALSPLTWAGLGVGLVLIGASIAIPLASSKVGVRVPVGKAEVEAEVATAGGGAPAGGRRR